MSDYDDYTPVATDEEEERRRYAYPPAEPVSSAPSVSAPAADSPSASLAVMAPPLTAPMMGSTEDLESRAGAKSYPVIGATQPTQSQYPAAESAEKLRAQGPPELHGWKKALDIAANVFPIGREIEAQTGLGSTGYQAKLGRAQLAATEESTLASAETTREKNAADTEEAQARAEALRHPPAKQGATPEETTLHDLMTGANGGPRVNPATGKPYNYLEALDAVNKTKQ